MAQFTVYHTDPSEQLGTLAIERAALAEIDAELRTIERGKSPRELARLLGDADALLVLGAPITAEVLDAMPRCRVVVRYGVGVDTLDLEGATARDVICAHVPDFCQEEVANHALLLMLAVVKTLIPLDAAIRAGDWRRGSFAPMQHLHGQTLGLVGCGHIARAMAKRGRALSMELAGYDPYIDAGVAEAAGITLLPSLEALLERSDVVSVHTPLSADTRHLIDAAALARMKPSAYLINTSRGPVIEEAALVHALRHGVIAGAGLDVFEQEPPAADSALRTMANVVLTPHSASYSDYAFALLSRRVAQSAVHVLTGHWPRFVANPGVRERLELQPCPDPPTDFSPRPFRPGAGSPARGRGR